MSADAIAVTIIYCASAYLAINALLGIWLFDALDKDEVLVCAVFFPIVFIVHLVKAVIRTFKDW